MNLFERFRLFVHFSKWKQVGQIRHYWENVCRKAFIGKVLNHAHLNAFSLVKKNVHFFVCQVFKHLSIRPYFFSNWLKKLFVVKSLSFRKSLEVIFIWQKQELKIIQCRWKTFLDVLLKFKMLSLDGKFLSVSGSCVSPVLNDRYLFSTDTIFDEHVISLAQWESLIFRNYARLISLLKKGIWSFLISLVNLLDFKDESSLGAVFDWNVSVVVEKILQRLLWFNAWLAVKWLFRKMGFDKVFDFLYCFAITLVWFFLFGLDFLGAFVLNSFCCGFVFNFERFGAFGLTKVRNFDGRYIIGPWFLYDVFAANRFVGWS